MDSGQGPVWSGVGTRNVQKLQISSNPYRGLRCFPYNNSLACWGASKNLTYGIPPPLPTTKGQQNLNRSLVVGAGNHSITGCARGTWVVKISSLAREATTGNASAVRRLDATWIGSDWINLPLWFTKQQNLGIGLQEVNRPSLIQVVSSSFIPPPHPPPPLYSCSPHSSCIPTVSIWCMWLFKLKTITFFTAITVWKC